MKEKVNIKKQMIEEHMKEYQAYIQNIGNRFDMYKNIVEAFNISSILYPGSHIDITPSLVAPKVIYVDSFKGTNKFFKELEVIRKYVTLNKIYANDPEIQFFYRDYREPLQIEKVDMIISQYAGFVGQDTKQYLKKDGILLCNDSHGDATLAYLDNEYQFIGVVEHNNAINDNDLSKYFEFKRPREIDRNKVLSTMKGPKYKFQAKSYIFKKLND